MLRKLFSTPLALLLLFIALSSPALARSRYQGFSELGGKRVVTSLVGATTYAQQSFPLCPYTVYLSGTTTIATIYSDNAGTPKSNPGSSTDSTGYLVFYSDSSPLDVKFSPISGTGTPWTITNFGGSGLAASDLPYVLANAPSGGNDATYLQSLITTYAPLGLEIVLRQGTYLVATELASVSGYPLRLRGVSHNYTGLGGTTIRATAAIRSVLALTSTFSVISDIKFDANQLATYGSYWNGTNLSRFTGLYFTNAVKDGLFLASPGGNDTSTLIDCWYVNNGTVYITSAIASQHGQRKSTVTGTAIVTAASPTITIAAGTDLTTLGIRKGDWLRTGSGAMTAASTYAGQISSVTSTTIVLTGNATNLPTAAQAGSGLNYAIGSGDGFREVLSADNNINTLIGGLSRGNAGAGYWFNSLFGDTGIGLQADGNGWVGYAIGQADNVNSLNGLALIRPYNEIGGYGDFFYGDATGVQIIAPVGGNNRDLQAAATTGAILKGQTAESIALGAEQNFLIQVANSGGTLQVKFLSDMWTAFGSALVDRFTAVPTALTNLPTVSSVVAFSGAGAGILSGSPTLLLLDTVKAQPQTPVVVLSIEENNTGTAYTASASTVSANVNGVTIVRPLLRLVDTSGTSVSWDTTAIPAGKTITIRASWRMK